MHNQIAAILPAARPMPSSDASVWAHFEHAGQEFQLFDEWNFGANVTKNAARRYTLSRVGDRSNPKTYETIAVARTVEAALRPLTRA